jgi:malate dehydrogenase (oxaloacetate-decarboxylating)
MNVNEEAISLHKKLRGKIEIRNKKDLTKGNLRLLYTPGVAAASMNIFKNKDLVYDYTAKGNLVAVITDGSAVLGLGDIGPEAALPVMEGKCMLLKGFANVDAVPICLSERESEDIIKTVKSIAPGFGGIVLEDISAPRCFEIEDKLQDLGIPVFHDDQHGTAIVVLAALINSCKVANRTIENNKIVINGAGAAGIAVSEILMNHFNLKDLIVCDSKGIISKYRKDLNKYKQEITKKTNKNKITGTLKDAVEGADVFIGVSKGNLLTKNMVKSMAKDPIIFALSNPDPEILPGKAKKAGAKIVATGRSDYPNQINNVLAFPGVFRGALDSRAKRITEIMKVESAYALAGSVKKLNVDNILPDVFDKDVVKNIAKTIEKHR